MGRESASALGVSKKKKNKYELPTKALLGDVEATPQQQHEIINARIIITCRVRLFVKIRTYLNNLACGYYY